MKKKTLTILPILFYSGFASASLYIHQSVETESKGDSRLKIIYDEEVSDTNIAKAEAKAKKDGKDTFVAKRDDGKSKEYNVKSKNNDHKISKGKEAHSNLEAPLEDKTPKYKDIVLSSEHEIKPIVKTIYAKMEEGFLSNSMRKHLESLGWEMRWSSGSDRKITVPYIIEHKENDVVEFVTQISELYGVFIDVYPKNKTIHVSD